MTANGHSEARSAIAGFQAHDYSRWNAQAVSHVMVAVARTVGASRTPVDSRMASVDRQDFPVPSMTLDEQRHRPWTLQAREAFAGRVVVVADSSLVLSTAVLVVEGRAASAWPWVAYHVPILDGKRPEGPWDA